MQTIYRVYSFGYSKHGQLGHGPDPETTTPNPPLEIKTLTPLVPHSIACGGAYSAVVMKNGQVFSFGDLRESTPQLEISFRKMQVVKVWCSAMFSLAMVEGGDVFLWGTMNKNVTQEFWIPQKLRFPSLNSKLTGIACGALHALFFANDGAIYAYGNNTQGQLGMDPTQTPELQIPQLIPFFRQNKFKILRAACGGSHSIVLTYNSQVWTFGANQYGQLGTGDFQDRLEPVNITGNFPNKVQSIACGDYHTMVVDSEGLLYTFGKNTCGQLGNGKFENSALPLLVDKLSGVVKVVAGGGFSCAHTLALTKDGTLYAWGNGKSGQLGFPVNESGMQPSPTQVTYFKGQKVEDIACGWLHTLVLTTAMVTVRPVVPRAPMYEPSLGTFDVLPNDILHIILRYLNTVDASRLGICSKIFFALTNDAEFWALSATQNLKPSLTMKEWDILFQKAKNNESWKKIYTQEFVKKNFEMYFKQEDLEKIPEPSLGFFDSIQNFISSKTIFERLFIQLERESSILMLGLDAAGKTSILYKLRLGEIETQIPTIGMNVETVQYKKTVLTIWDVGGPDKIRNLWQHYFKNTKALVFVIDSNDRDRIHESQTEFLKILREVNHTIPVLIFANKQDLPNAMCVAEIKDVLGKWDRGLPWYIQPSCAITGEGLYEGFFWLCNVMKMAKFGVDVRSLHGNY